MGCQCLVIVPPVEFQKPKDLPIEREPPLSRLPQECELKAVPESVTFALTAVGKERKEVVKIANVGGRTCELMSVRVVGTVPDGHSAFVQAEALPRPYLLMKGATLSVEVIFRPDRKSTKFEGVLRVDSSSPTTPRLTVKLEGESAGPCFRVAPPKLNLGDTQRGCSSRAKAITLLVDDKPHCPDTVTVTTIDFVSGSSPSFSFVSKPPLPFVIRRGQNKTVDVMFQAKDLGKETGEVLIKVAEYPDDFNVALEGRGVPDASQTDTFIQKDRSLVDILFVIDNSCSMGDEQDSLADNFNSFIKWAIQLKSDYHIGVTTTDVSGRRYAPGCLQGGASRVISLKTPNPVVAFSENVRVGTRGSSREEGLEAAYQSLLPHSRGNKVCTDGFYRNDAMLSLIFVSDEPDQSRRPVSFYLNFFRTLKKDKPQLVSASAVVGPERGGCSSQHGNAGPGPRYRSMARELGGLTASICAASWSNTLNQLGIASFGRQSKFKLSRTALPSSIIVKVGEDLVPRSETNGWSFDEKTNTVLFAPTFIPEVGKVISIQYQVACQP